MPISITIDAPTTADIAALQAVVNGLAGSGGGSGGGGGVPTPVAPTLIAHGIIPGSSTGGTSGNFNTVGSELLILGVSCSLNSTVTVSDSLNNTWIPLAPYGYTGGYNQIQLFYVLKPVVGISHTITIAGPALSYATGDLMAFDAGTGAAAVFDKQTGISGTTVPIQPGSVTPTAPNSLIVSCLSWYNTPNASVASIDSGFTVADQVPPYDSNYYGCAGAYLVQGTTPAAVNPTWLVTGSGFEYIAVTLAVFKFSM